MGLPYKIVDRTGQNMYGVVVSSLQDLIKKAREKFGITSSVNIVLESDGTKVDEEEYFSTLEQNTCFMILREDEDFKKEATTQSSKDIMLELQTMKDHLKEEFDELKKKFDQDQNKLLDVRALFHVRNFSQLCMQTVENIHSQTQFEQRILPKEMKGRSVLEKKQLYMEFSRHQTRLPIIDRKLAIPRNQAGHPIKKFEEVSLSQLKSNLERCRVNGNISEIEEEVLLQLAAYFVIS